MFGRRRRAPQGLKFFALRLILLRKSVANSSTAAQGSPERQQSPQNTTRIPPSPFVCREGAHIISSYREQFPKLTNRTTATRETPEKFAQENKKKKVTAHIAGTTRWTRWKNRKTGPFRCPQSSKQKSCTEHQFLVGVVISRMLVILGTRWRRNSQTIKGVSSSSVSALRGEPQSDRVWRITRRACERSEMPPTGRRVARLRGREGRTTTMQRPDRHLQSRTDEMRTGTHKQRDLSPSKAPEQLQSL